MLAGFLKSDVEEKGMLGCEEHPIFALDIGTRTVSGVIAVRREGWLEILAQEVAEHQGRAMYDGQIHDIPRVAEAVAYVKAALEEKAGRPLSEAAIAAAGRALKTWCGRATLEVDSFREIDAETVRALEFTVLRQAREEIRQADPGAGDFYCVGHGVLSYTLDGLELTNLVGHRGKVIGAEVIATFLPASVVNSLFSVLRRTSLEPAYITLEPIAAIEVTIPEEMRLLNLALVDVGAGTSDIAVTKNGTVIGYGMVPVAGDEVTEAVAEACVVDFHTAEEIKRALNTKERITFSDVLHNEITITREEIIAAIEPTVDRLAAAVAETVMELNGGRAPKSVLCVGGGSQTPLFLSKLAACLGLPESRVGIKKRAQLTGILAPEEDILGGPEGVTVAGIALTALKKKGYNLICVAVNGKEHRVFNPGDLRVVNCLSLLEYDPRALFGKNGRDLRFFVNGQETVVYGELARPAAVRVNGEEADLQTPVKDGDRIEVTPAENGRDAAAKVGDFLHDAFSLQVFLDGREVSLPPSFRLNDAPADPEMELKEGDRLWIGARHTLGQLLALSGLDPNKVRVAVNGAAASLDYVLKTGDAVITMEDNSQEFCTSAEAGNKALVAAPPDEEIAPAEGIRVTVNGQEVVLSEVATPLFIDVLRHVDLDPSKQQGKLRVLLNGRPAQYTERLKNGDVIEIRWE